MLSLLNASQNYPINGSMKTSYNGFVWWNCKIIRHIVERGQVTNFVVILNNGNSLEQRVVPSSCLRPLTRQELKGDL